MLLKDTSTPLYLNEAVEVYILKDKKPQNN